MKTGYSLWEGKNVMVKRKWMFPVPVAGYQRINSVIQGPLGARPPLGLLPLHPFPLFLSKSLQIYKLTHLVSP